MKFTRIAINSTRPTRSMSVCVSEARRYSERPVVGITVNGKYPNDIDDKSPTPGRQRCASECGDGGDCIQRFGSASGKAQLVLGREPIYRF
ncbi:hypothetical protein ACOMHN_064084 [Nucella lapillus]